MSDAEQREEAAFEAALQLPADHRAAYLDKACAGDADLRRRVEVLLGAFERAGGFMKQPVTPERTARSSLPPTEKPGDRIGRYKLLEQIGEGGCGVVYVAEQEEPVRRRVALKVIKLGMDTKQVIARFDAERQALAMMDHPNIAKIHDAGVTDAPLPASGHPLPVGRGEGQGEASANSQPSTLNPQLSAGRPYFVMELVHGVRITDYCEEQQLSPRQRLDLFIQVCRAIQHAHQKGVIHRDIKPSNILVTVNDGVPVPKVIDFGIAKATQGRLTDQTVYTAFEQFIGTPAYMSPEQASMTSLDIDTRSDIYSLGVLLYELLTGKTPFDAKELLAAGLDEMRRTIREVEPVKPSTRLTEELSQTQRTLSLSPAGGEGVRRTGEGEARSTTIHPSPALKELIQALRGDLDWIVMKCLEKDRARRYETANGLATDINRHLNNEPIAARPPSRLYRFQKSIQRNKLAFGAATAIATVLVLGVIVSTWQAVRATRAERQQSKLREQAQKARDDAERQRKRAEQNAEESRARLKDYADVLYGLAYEYATGRVDPHSPEEALPLIRKALEVSDTNVVYIATLGQVYAALGREKDAMAAFERAIQLAPDSDVGYWDMASHYAHRPEDHAALQKARELAFKSVQLTQTNDNGALNLLAKIYSRLGLREEAIALFRWSVQVKPERWSARICLAWEYITGPKPLRAPEKALSLVQMAVELTHTNIWEPLGTLGVVYGRLGQFQKSVETIEKAMRLPGSTIGSAENYFSLAVACYHLGQFAKAEAYYEMGRSAVENGDTFLPVGTLKDAESVRLEAEEQLGKRKADTPLATGTSAALDSPATNVVALTPAERGLLEAIRKQLTNTMEMSRGEIFARALHFTQAIFEFSEEVKTNRHDMLLFVKLISLLLETGDLAAYREHCHEALHQYAATQDLAIAQELAGACLLAPLPAADTRQAAKLADFALSQPQDARGSRQAHFNKALADFRLGRWHDAVEGMNRLLADTNPPSPPIRRQMIVGASATLAMAHQHLGDLEARQGDLARATKPLGELWHAQSRGLPYTWHETLIAHALLREAEALIQSNAAIIDKKNSTPR